jgi:hypothetical protein
MRWHRRTQIVVVVVVLAALFAAGAGMLYAQRSFATNYLHADVSSGWSMAGCCDQNTAHVGGVLAFGIESANVSSNATIIMRPATLPLGLPPHVHLIGQTLLFGGLGIARGWPPGQGETPSDVFPHYPLDGYKVRPGVGFIVGLGFRIDAPGAFLIGPMTVHAEVPLVGTSGPAVPIQVTYSQYAALCVQVPLDPCTQWAQEQAAAIQAGKVQHAPGIIYNTPPTGL